MFIHEVSRQQHGQFDMGMASCFSKRIIDKNLVEESKKDLGNVWLYQGWRLGVALMLGIFGAIVFPQKGVLAQITTDGTLGLPAQTLTGPDYNITPDLGRTVGSNLFHSFGIFNLSAGEVADFQSDSGISNILARVTGGNASLIDGQIFTSSPDVNLFFINPFGIVFGPNASLDVGGQTGRGAFVATTVDALVWPNGAQFSATNPGDANSLLTIVGDPGGFLTSTRTPGPIVNSGGNLTAYADQSLLLLGGDVVLDGGELNSRGGRVEIGSITGEGMVILGADNSRLSFQFPPDVLRGIVFLNNGATVNVSTIDESAGEIFIKAGSIFIANRSRLSSSTFGRGDGGIVSLQATNTVALTESSTIFSTGEQTASGDAGLIQIEADSVFVNAGFLTTNNQGSGSAGSIDIRANNLIEIDNKSEITSASNNTNTSDFGFIQFAVSQGSLVVNNSKISTTNSGTGWAGAINIGASDQISILNSELLSEGNWGWIFIGRNDAHSDFFPPDFPLPKIVSINNSTLSTNNGIAGRAGEIIIRASDLVSIVGNSELVSKSENNNTNTDEFGFIDIAVPQGSVSLNNSTISTTNFGEGWAGDISISATSEIFVNQSSIFSRGNLGRILLGQSEDYASFSPRKITIDNSELNTRNNSVSIDLGGDIEVGNISIQANESALLANGTRVRSSTSRPGNAGSITIEAGSITLNNNSSLETETSARGDAGFVFLQTNGGTVSLDNSKIFSTVESGGVGQGGYIQIEAGSVALNNDSSLETQTNGTGDAGYVLIQAEGDVSLTGSYTTISSNVEQEAIGNAGGIEINARSLSMTGGAELQALTLGGGFAGDILINASDFVDLSGVRPNGFSTGLITASDSETALGQGGSITVNTGTLGLSNGAVLSSRTLSPYTGGDIQVNVNSLGLTGGGQILVSTFGSGNAGQIFINTKDNIILSGSDPTFADRLAEFGDKNVDPVEPVSGVFADTRPGSVSTGGGINISAQDLLIQDGAKVSVNNQGTGIAGNIQIQARDIQLNNQGSISAETASGEGGNIILTQSGFLLLLRDSTISTTAGTANAGGNGGNITITTPLDIIAAPSKNNDIKANAFTGSGGNIRVTAATLRNIAPRPLNPQTNDISASSTYGRDGEVTTKTLNIDPTQGLTNLPQVPVDVSQLITQRCAALGRDSQTEMNKFIITGRGGLPPSPNDTLQNDSVEANWVTTDPPTENREEDDSSANPDALRVAGRASLQGDTERTIPARRTLTGHNKDAGTQDSIPPTNSVPKTPTVVEAQGWVYGAQGEVILTAQSPTVTPHSVSQMPTASCNPPSSELNSR